MELVIEKVIKDKYSPYAEFIGKENLEKIIQNRNKSLEIESIDDEGLNFDLTLVTSVIKAAVSLIDGIISVLKFKRGDNDLSEFKLEAWKKLTEQMSKEELEYAMGANTFEDLVKSVNYNLE